MLRGSMSDITGPGTRFVVNDCQLLSYGT